MSNKNKTENTEKAAEKPQEKAKMPSKHASARIGLTPEQWLYKSLALIQKAVTEKDRRRSLRAFRYLVHFRRYVPTETVLEIAKKSIIDEQAQKAVEEVLGAVLAHENQHGRLTKEWKKSTAEEGGASQEADTDVAMEGDTKKEDKGDKGSESKQKEDGKHTPQQITLPTPREDSQPETIAFFLVLGLGQLAAQKQFQALQTYSRQTVEWVISFNRRSLDLFSSRAYSYLALASEKLGQLSRLRPYLLAAHRTACLRHDEMGQATLLNILLRVLIQSTLYDQAQKLLAKTSFPEAISNNQLVRYLYYLGKVQAVQLDYTDAYATLLQAFRKTPSTTGFAFKLAVQQVLITVQLLLGEVPEKRTFRSRRSREKSGLEPYYHLTQAVRIGDVTGYFNVVQKYKSAFAADDTLTLVLRLRHNVIKTGLKAIASSYSAIGFHDVAAKLDLESAQDAEFLCAKAIRDGVIDAVLDHEQQCLKSREVADIYATSEPQEAFHKRISFCLDVRNEAVKAMRYPPEAYKQQIDELEAARREAEEEEAEIMKHIEDGEFDDGDDDDDEGSM